MGGEAQLQLARSGRSRETSSFGEAIRDDVVTLEPLPTNLLTQVGDDRTAAGKVVVTRKICG